MPGRTAGFMILRYIPAAIQKVKGRTPKSAAWVLLSQSGLFDVAPMALGEGSTGLNSIRPD